LHNKIVSGRLLVQRRGGQNDDRARTDAVLLPLYHYAVRPTVIGAVLNGGKYAGAFAVAAVV
jgi:hypothetical protein